MGILARVDTQEVGQPTPRPPTLSGLLLAGGDSTRMGRDKTRVLFEGEPLASRVARALRECCENVTVASGDGLRMAWLGWSQVADALPEAGPLGGIVAGLEAAPTVLVAVVAADMPFASPAVFRLLASQWHGEDVVVPVSTRGLEPLHAVYTAAAAPALRAALEAGTRAVRDALAGLNVRLVSGPALEAADPSGRFAFNVNRPEDLA